MLKLKLVSAVVLILATCTTCAIAQSSYPDHEVRVIVPNPPGGVTDILARVVGQTISAELRQPIVVDNRPGADEMIGTLAVVRAKPDGYTLLVASNGPITAGPHLHSQMQYNSLKDLTPIAILGQITPVMFVPATSSIKTIPELIALAKEKPGKLNYGSFGTGTYAHVGMEDFKQRTETQIIHIPYKGASPAVTAVMQGEVDVQIMNLGNIAEYVKNGNFRLIGAASARRSALLPDLPTVAEGGVTGFSTGSWWGLFGPAGMPPAVVEKIRASVLNALQSEEVKKVLATSTIQPVTLSADQLPRFIAEDLENWGRQINAAGIKPD